MWFIWSGASCSGLRPLRRFILPTFYRPITFSIYTGYHFEAASGLLRLESCLLQHGVVMRPTGGCPDMDRHVAGVEEARHDRLECERRRIDSLHVDHVTPRNVSKQHTVCCASSNNSTRDSAPQRTRLLAEISSSFN